jgi:DNA-directed RNA polymerase subunit L
MKRPHFEMPEVYMRWEVDDLVLALENRIRDLEQEVDDLKNEIIEANERME